MMSSLYIGATGMITLGEGMGTIANNLSNLNTIGFKERLHLFEDLMSSPVPTSSSAIGTGNVLPTSYSQQGHGSRTSAVISRFYENGALQKGDRVTVTATDIHSATSMAVIATSSSHHSADSRSSFSSTHLQTCQSLWDSKEWPCQR